MSYLKEEIKELNAIRLEMGLAPYSIKKRSCLCCDTQFESVNSGHRLCDRCSKKANSMDSTQHELILTKARK
jgi:hypothetical protein